MKKYVLLFIVLLVTFSPSAAAAVKEGDRLYVVVTCQNARAAAGKKADVIIEFSRGDSVVATGKVTSDYWAEVVFYDTTYYCENGNGFNRSETKKVTAWMFLPLMSQFPSAGETTKTVVADGRVAIRDAPNGNREGWIQPGAQVTTSNVIEMKGIHWYKISVGETSGWISGEYLV